MNEDLIFRFLVIALMLSAFIVSAYHRRKAQQSSGDEIDRRKEGDFIMIALRLGGGLIWLLILVYMIYPPAVSWATVPLPSWIRWLGVFGGFVAVILLIWMFRSLGTNITDTVITRREHSLVTHGPYRWIRHPLYTFGALLFLSLSLVTQIWLIPLLAVPTFAILLQRTTIEEKALQERFGEEYTLYSKRTGRFFPRLS
ncbi:MAG: isoprenylcysteine carboxylmethyltransferase family protein [Chloroflexota bacterium]|nr:MAG: isoprenylcysteine carboxylmethyltransferase family protein [Chloroflexota bacterium]